MKMYAGIDLGGSFTKFVLLGSDNSFEELISLPTPTDGGPSEIVDMMVRGYNQLIQQAGIQSTDVSGVGVGSPGQIDRSRGILLSLPNLPGITDFPLGSTLTNHLHLPVVIENDANAAAFGEYTCGAGKDIKDMVMLTLGTGLGSGIILDGTLLEGAHGIAAELGHMIVEPDGRQCPCGQRGCIEQYVSASSIVRNAEKVIDRNSSGFLPEVLKGQGSLTCRDIEDAWLASDSEGVQLWEEAMRYLAIGCVNICRIFDPECIVLAGGMAAAGDNILVPLKKYITELEWDVLTSATTIAIAKLGGKAGAVGAAAIAISRLENQIP